jgi:cellulose synthase/poly-beta-1,6-N-acetylglucosamine synthase-like glycosyltransferase
MYFGGWIAYQDLPYGVEICPQQAIWKAVSERLYSFVTQLLPRSSTNRKTSPPVYMKLTEVMDALGEPYELVFVDDGSRDGTFTILSDIYQHDHNVNVVRLRRNFGQTAGLAAGFDFARGDIIISMDGDLQHDPEEIPRFLER